MNINPDIINGLIEFLGSGFILNHCRVLLKQRMVRGVSTVSVVFFTLWGLWNLYYYPNLDQWWSFLGGVMIVLANSLWIILLIVYREKTSKEN